MADGKVVYEIRGDNSKFQSDVNQTESIAKSKTSAIGGFAKSAVIGVGAAVGAVGAGIVAFSKDAIGVGSEFDKSMAQVAATMGVTVDEIGNLRDYAMEMGATTAFSATEAADALNYMALAGYDAGTSMKMLPNVLNLASAGNIDLARASDMVTDAQSALGLSLDETSDLVDKMAKASSKSNTSVEQLGDAVLTIGGTARNLKGGTTELATALGILADNGIKGAEGGTALRNILLSLTPKSDDAAEAMEAIGLKAYDANGEMRSLTEIFGDMSKAMEGMSTQERSNILSSIFNKVDLKSVNALLGTSTERFEELTSAIDASTGAAEQMASTQLDNLAGDVTLFKSALEGAKITLSNNLTPTLRKFVQFGTKEIGKLDKAFQQGGISGLADQFGKTLGKALNMLINRIPDFISVAGKLAFSLMDEIGNSLVKNFPRILRNGLDMIKQLANGLVDRIPSLMSGIGSIIGDVITNIPNILKLGFNIIKGVVKGIVDGVPKFVGEIGKAIKGLFSHSINEDVEESKRYLDDLKTKIDEIGMDADELYDSLSGVEADTKMAEYWLGVFDRLHTKTTLTKDEQLLLNQAVEYLNTNVLPETAQLIQDESGYWHGNTDEIRENIEAMKQREIAKIYLEKMRGELEKIATLQIEMDKEQAKLFELKGKRDELTPKIEEVTKKYNSLADELSSVQKETGSLYPSYEQGTKALKDYAASIGVTEDNFVSWDKVMQTLIDEQSDLQRQMKEVDGEMLTHANNVVGLKSQINKLNDAVDDYAKHAADAETKAAEASEKAGKAVGDGYVRGMDSKIRAVREKAGELSKVAIDGMKRVAMIQSPSKRARKEVGEQIGQGEVLGMEDKIPAVKKASEKLINAINFDVPSIDVQSATADGGNDTRINSIIAVLNKYLPRIGAPIVLDTGELVGATVDKYDHELGILQQRRARYE